MKKTLSFVITIMAFVGLVFSAGLVYAYKGDSTVTGPNYSEDRHTAMTLAFENSDYDSWYELMTEDGRTPGVLRYVTEENFNKFVELREARLAGDLDRELQLKEELGVGQRDGSGNSGFGKGFGNGNGKQFSQKRMGQGSGNCINN